MDIGIIGSGNIGRAAARGLLAAGHPVLLSNSRGPDTLSDVVAELGDAAQAVTPEEAARRGEVVPVDAGGLAEGGRRQQPGAPVFAVDLATDLARELLAQRPESGVVDGQR